MALMAGEDSGMGCSSAPQLLGRKLEDEVEQRLG